MSGDKPQSGFLITQGRVALLLSIITLMGVFYQGTKFVLGYDYRISALEEKWSTLDQNQTGLRQEIGRLSTTINELNLVLRGVEIRQQAQEDAGVNK